MAHMLATVRPSCHFLTTLNVVRLCAVGLLCAILSACTYLEPPIHGMPRPEQWLSEDTVLLIRVPNAAQAKAHWAATGMGKAWADPGVEYWRSMQFDPAIQGYLERVGMGDLPGLLGLIEGEALAAVELRAPQATSGGVGLTGIGAGVYLVVDFGLNAPEARHRIKQKAKSHLPAPGEFREHIGDVFFHSDRTTFEKSPCSAWVDDTWILASSHEALLDLVARRYGIQRAGAPRKAALADTTAWHRMAVHRGLAADLFAFVHVARLHDVAIEPLRANMQEIGMGEQAAVTLEALGIDALELAGISVEMREEGFYTRRALTLRHEPKGLLFVTDGSAPLRTPPWVAGHVESFSAVRMRSPLEIKQSFVDLAAGLSPMVAPYVESLESLFQNKTGLALDTLLGAFGSEVAMLQRKGAGLPEMVILWEIADRGRLDEALGALKTSGRVTAAARSYRGYRSDVYTVPPLPMAFHTSEIDGFFMLATADTWYRELVDRVLGPVENQPSPAEDAPKPEPLLTTLEAPFTPLPSGMHVVGRSYSDPRPGLTQINAFLPLAVPMLNIQLQAYGSPKIPQWVVSAIPPLLPFAQNAFPTVQRIAQSDQLILEETWSAFDPIASPLAATVFVIVNQYLSGM